MLGESRDLRNFMLQEQRQYVIDKVKAPMMKALIILANRLPEPTKQNTNHPNTDVLIDIWDKFFQMEDNPGREPLFRAIRKIMIAENEHDPYYRDRINVFVELLVEEILNGKWRPRGLDHPPSNWKVDPDIRGAGFEFIKDRYEHKEVTNA